MSEVDKNKHPYEHIRNEFSAIKELAESEAYWIKPQWHDTRFYCDERIKKCLNMLAAKIINLRKMHEKLREVRITEMRQTEFHRSDGVVVKPIEYYVGPNTMQELDEMEWPGDET